MAKSVPRMADEFNLDFRELKSRDKAGYAFQALIGVLPLPRGSADGHFAQHVG